MHFKYNMHRFSQSFQHYIILINTLLEGSRSISNMKKLQTLDLSLNKFNKSILHSLSALPSLRNLMLGSNNLSGSFPTKGMLICFFVWIERHERTKNFLSFIPFLFHVNVELSNFGDLETLDLRNTSLSGPITIQGKFLPRCMRHCYNY